MSVSLRSDGIDGDSIVPQSKRMYDVRWYASMKTRASGGAPTSSRASVGSNASTPSASRRRATWTFARATFSRSVKFSFRSIAG